MRYRIDPDLVANGKVAGRTFDLFQMVPAFVCIQYPHMRYLNHKLQNVAGLGVTDQTDICGVNSKC
jgi:hypothetical protein